MLTLKFYSSGIDVFKRFTFVYSCVSPYSQVVLGRIVESSHLKKKALPVIDNNWHFDNLCGYAILCIEARFAHF